MKSLISDAPSPGARVPEATRTAPGFTRYADLWFSVILVLALFGLLAWDNPIAEIGRFVIGLAVGLLLPGYGVVCVLFPRKADLDAVERWGLSLVVSAILLILAAWLISLSGMRLDARSVAGSTAGLILVVDAVAAWRRRSLPANQVWLPSAPRGRAPYAVLGLTVLLGIGTWATVSTNLNAVQPSFSVTDPGGHLSGYPFQVLEGQRYPLKLDIGNPSGQVQRFRLVIRDNRHIVRRQPVAVGARGRWSQMVVLPSAPPARAETVYFQLYQGGHMVRELWVRYHIVP